MKTMPLVGLIVFLGLAAGPAVGAGEKKLAGTTIPEAALQVLENSKRLEVFSLGKETAKGGFNGRTILGRVDVDGARARQVVDALKKSVGEASGKEGKEGNVTYQYGVRGAHNAKTVDLLISFQSGGILVRWADDKANYNVMVYTTNSSQTVLNRILQEAKMPLPSDKE